MESQAFVVWDGSASLEALANGSKGLEGYKRLEDAVGTNVPSNLYLVRFV